MTTTAQQVPKGQFNALLDAKHWDELRGAAQEALTKLRVDGFMKRMHIGSAGRPVEVHIVSSLAPTLSERFRLVEHDGADPVTRHVARQGIPLAWEVEAMCVAVSEAPYRELKDLGIMAGLSVAVRGEQSFSRIDFYSQRASGFTDEQLRSDLLMFGCYLNEAARALWHLHAPQVSAPVLTSREQQCLRWSASGKTSSEIGSILGISHNTVYFHLKKAASKFNVYGTRHAISRALELGLI